MMRSIPPIPTSDTTFYPVRMIVHVFTLFLILSLMTELHAQAQNDFTGSFVLQARQFDGQGNATGTRDIPMAVSPHRIKVMGINRLDPTAVTRNLGASDMLIRLDREDFIFQTSETEAVVVKKQELQLMMNMMNPNAARPNPAQSTSNTSIRETNETATVNGYRTRKVIVTDPDRNVEHHAWVTKEININMGMLAESWMNVLPISEITPFTHIVDDMGTPVRIETRRNGQLIGQVDITNINTNMDRSMLEVPGSVKLVTLQEMMLNRMRNY